VHHFEHYFIGNKYRCLHRLPWVDTMLFRPRAVAQAAREPEAAQAAQAAWAVE